VARRFGIAQFQPDTQVYARTRCWRMIGLDKASPWNPRTDGPSWLYRVCRGCGLRFRADQPRCPRCGDDSPGSATATLPGRLRSCAPRTSGKAGPWSSDSQSNVVRSTRNTCDAMLQSCSPYARRNAVVTALNSAALSALTVCAA
jgi:hypothetical protein